MLRFLPLAASLALGIATLAVPSLAAASTAIAKSGGAVAVREDRIVFATTPTRTVAFEQLHLDAVSGDVAWIVPVPKGATVGFAHPRFIPAFDEATAPVLAPAPALGCGTAPVRALEGDESGSMETLSTVTVSASVAAKALGDAGYVVDAGVRSQLDDVERAGEAIAIVELRGPADARTPTIRVLGPKARPLPTLVHGGLSTLQGFVVGSERARLLVGETRELEFERLLWDPAGPSYERDLLATETLARDGVVVTFSGHEGLFAAQPTGSALAIAPVIDQYLGEPACITRAFAAASSATPVATVPGDGGLAPDAFTCGTRSDLAIALAGLAPRDAWITRIEGLSVGIDGRLAGDGHAPLPSFHVVDRGGCTESPPATGGGSTPVPTNPPPSSTGSDDDDGSHAGAGEACAATLDACSRSSSSSSSSSSGCGGDSSSSHDSCGGDSSSSSDGCSSGKTTSSSDDGCVFSAKDARRNARRVRFSPIMLAMAALATILRRLGRPRSEVGMLESPATSSVRATDACPTPPISNDAPTPGSAGSSPTSGCSNG